MNTITAFILTLAALGAAGCNDQSNPVDPSYGQGGADAGGLPDRSGHGRGDSPARPAYPSTIVGGAGAPAIGANTGGAMR